MQTTSLLHLLFLTPVNCLFKFFLLFLNFFPFILLFIFLFILWFLYLLFTLFFRFQFLFQINLIKYYIPEFFENILIIKKLDIKLVFIRCCYISALALACFRMTRGRATCFQPETIVTSPLHLLVLLFRVLFNHTWKHQFVMLHCHVCLGGRMARAPFFNPPAEESRTKVRFSCLRDRCEH